MAIDNKRRFAPPPPSTTSSLTMNATSNRRAGPSLNQLQSRHHHPPTAIESSSGHRQDNSSHSLSSSASGQTNEQQEVLLRFQSSTGSIPITDTSSEQQTNTMWFDDKQTMSLDEAFSDEESKMIDMMIMEDEQNQRQHYEQPHSSISANGHDRKHTTMTQQLRYQQEQYQEQQTSFNGGGCLPIFGGLGSGSVNTNFATTGGGNYDSDGSDRGGIFPSLVQFSPSIFSFGRNKSGGGNGDGLLRSVQKSDRKGPDAILAEELNKLSMEERDQADNDIHCISDDYFIKEQEEFVQSKLEEMETELQNTLRNSSYELALSIDAKYIQNRDLRLIFLRADRFDCKLSAGRFIRFLDYKLDLFGPNKLCKDITWDDLNEDDTHAAQSGFVQFHPKRDPKGRATIFAMPKFLPTVKSSSNAYRAMMYAVMSLLKYNVDIQQRGFVGVMYDVGLQQKDESMMFGLAKFRHCLPLKISAIHHCSDNKFVRAMFSIELMITQTYERVRYRGHFGTHMECQYAMYTFGMPKDNFPVTESGEYRLNQHMDLLHSFRRHEQDEATVKAKQQRRDVYAVSLSDESENSNRSGSSNTSSMISRGNSPNKNKDMVTKLGNAFTHRAGSPSINSNSSTGWIGPHSSSSASNRRVGSCSSGSSNSGGGGSLIPQRSDVLLGRGKQIQEHSGNVHFRKLLDMHLKRYEQVGKYEKTEIAEQIVRMIKESGRFLKHDPTGNWVEVDDETARYKVSSSFRTRRSVASHRNMSS